MVRADWTIYEEDYWAINSVLKELIDNSNSTSVLLIDKTGQLIASVGMEPEFDLMSFASLCAADFEANAQLATLIGEKDFSTLYHQGVDESMYLSRVAQAIILVVLFNKRTTLGLVRLRVKKAAAQLAKIFEDIAKRADQERASGAVSTPFAEITDEDIDNLFSV